MGLVVLLVVDIALVLLAFRSPLHRPADPASAALSESAVASGPATSGPTGTAPGSSGLDLSRRVALVLFDTEKAWRLTQGSCEAGGAELAVTTNGGKTWRSVTPPLRVVTSLSVTDENHVQIVGGGEGCATVTRRTADGGTTWTAGAAWTAWALNPGTPGQVLNPSGKALGPCASAGAVEVQSAAPAAAVVLCSNGKLLDTADTGGTWADLSKVLEVRAVDATLSAGKLVATVAYRAEGCSGLQTGTVTGGALTKLGCVDRGPTSSSTGSSALAMRADRVGLRVGTALWRSSDGGKTWSAVG